MSFRPDLKAYADWWRAVTRSGRRNQLDLFADEMVRLQEDLATLSVSRAALLDRAAHEAFVRATTGGSPEEIAAAVRALKSR